MRETSSPSTVAVDGRHTSECPPGDMLAPDVKSSCPPTPENWRAPIVSAATCPARSTASAPLIEIMRSFRAMTSGEFVTSTGRKRTAGLSCSQA